MVTQDRIKELFLVDDDFNLVWRKNQGHVKAGSLAGQVHSKNGYLYVGVDGKKHRAHRLIWVLYNGDCIAKTDIIDHIDGNKLNNNIGNLRLATRSQNMHNRSHQKNNKLGVKNVRWHKKSGTYQVRVNKNNRSYHIGYYKNLGDADEAAKKARKEIHGEFSHD